MANQYVSLSDDWRAQGKSEFPEVIQLACNAPRRAGHRESLCQSGRKRMPKRAWRPSQNPWAILFRPASL
jgi:hypothetical protein